MEHDDLTVICATLGGRWTSRRAPFAAAALVTAQLVVPRAHASTHSHIHITPSESLLSHSPLHTHVHTHTHSRTHAAAGGRAALILGMASQPHAARRGTSSLIVHVSAQLPQDRKPRSHEAYTNRMLVSSEYV